MNIPHVLFICFLSAALFGGKSGLVRATINTFMGLEGGNGSINCHFTESGSNKFFCKKECKEEDILIKTDGVSADRGRYSVTYAEGSSGRTILSVAIAHLTQSDSGRYRCGLGSSLVPDSYSDFEIRVSDELPGTNSGFIRTDTEGQNVTYPCLRAVNRGTMFFCKGECKTEEDILIETDNNRAQRGRYSIEYTEGSVLGLYVTITPVAKSDTGKYKCGYGRALSPDFHYTFSIIVIDPPTTLKPRWTLHPFSTSVPSASKPPPTEPPPITTTAAATTTATATATQSLSSSSGSCTPSSVFPESTNQPASATSEPKRPVQHIPTSARTASTPPLTPPPPPPPPPPTTTTTTTQSLSSSSGSFTPSSVFPETTNQPAASTTSEPKRPVQRIPASVRSASIPPPTQPPSPPPTTTTTTSTTTQSLNSSSAFSHVPRPGYVLPLVVCVALAGVLLLVASLLLLYIRKTRKNQQQKY